MELVKSIFLYLSVISITILAAYQTEWALRKEDIHRNVVYKRNKKTYVNSKTILGSVMVILIPSIFAGIRADSVGTDVNGYAKLIMQQAEAVDSFSQLNQMDRTYTEYGYRLYAFIVSRRFHGTGWWLFFTQLLIMFFLFCAVYLFRKDISVWKSIAIFMFCYYHVSFTMMRQTMAMSVLLVAIYFLKEKKYFSYMLLSALALSFHTFSLVVALTIFILWIFRSWYQAKWQKRVVMVLCIGFIVGWRMIVKLSAGLFVGILRRYARYFTESIGASVIAIITSPAFLIHLFLFFMAMKIMRYDEKKQTDHDDILFILSLLGVTCSFLQSYFVEIYRFGIYFLFFNIIYLSRTFLFHFIYGKRIRTQAFIGILFIYWLCDGMLSSHSSTAIFKFRF